MSNKQEASEDVKAAVGWMSTHVINSLGDIEKILVGKGGSWDQINDNDLFRHIYETCKELVTATENDKLDDNLVSISVLHIQALGTMMQLKMRERIMKEHKEREGNEATG